ncbi:MAG: SPFH domain-containing protein [Lachnospiraceae bacterium]|nr:SPFH domain-containing protein [Lachnospiraceae bacterium]
MNVIKNESMGNMLCYKVPCEDFNNGSQLIVAEYEEALFMKDGIVEETFTAGKYTLTTENFPFLTTLKSNLVTGGVSAYNCKIYYISKQDHPEKKWGTSEPINVLDPYWQTYLHVQGRGAYTIRVKDGKKFFIKMVGANRSSSDDDLVRNFRTAFIQNISDELAAYLTSSTEEIIVVCNRKKQLADALTNTLQPVLDEYGVELVNFYIENIGVVDDENLKSITRMRRERQERMFERQQNIEDERMKYGLSKEKAEADRYVSGQAAQADYERMKIRDQDGNNGWARQEEAEILKTMARNEGSAGEFAGAGMGIGMGLAMGGISKSLMGDMFPGGNANMGLADPNPSQAAGVKICPKCNATVPEGMKFCGSCGSLIETPKKKCANCGAEIPEGMRFCGQCGTPVSAGPKICANCGAEIPEGMKFCGRCGNRVEQGE